MSAPTSDGPYMTAAEVAAYGPHRRPGAAEPAVDQTRARITGARQWDAGQILGRHRAIGCVALEITQRCNLDCTLCYLSEKAEAVHDVPLPVLFRRIDMIRDLYGAGTDIQITGGEPTLRRRDDLARIVRHAADRGLRPALFTNGIRATRELLADLAANGLVDVAFHVDMTQERHGYDSEAALNAVRADYIARARGLGLFVIFNTTIFDGNRADVPMLARFFAQHSDVVGFASFQLQADAGRGVAGVARHPLTLDGIAQAIADGTGSDLGFNRLRIGHERCNRYGVALVAGDRVFDLYAEPGPIQAVMQAFGDLNLDRQRPWRIATVLMRLAGRRPGLAVRVVGWLVRLALRVGPAVLRAGFRVRKISYFIHSFMDSCRLERPRIDACSFMVATEAGAVSMCLHNARRDSHVFEPATIADGGVARWWDPATGAVTTTRPEKSTDVTVPLKRLKGRARRAVDGNADIAPTGPQQP